MKLAVAVLLFFVATGAHAQSSNDINLNRLAEAVNAISENQLPHAEELLNSVLASSRDDPDALNLLGVVRARQDRVADAERLFRRALASSPAHIGAHINLAELLLTELLLRNSSDRCDGPPDGALDSWPTNKSR